MNKSHTLISAALFLFASTLGFAADINSAFADSIMPAYLSIQSALAADNLEGAKSSASALSHQLHHGEYSSNPIVIKLDETNDGIQHADDIKTAHQLFSNLSNQVIRLSSEVGVSQSNELWIAHCPMAFNNKGASWIQSNENISNPYYGKMMLRCGSIQSKIGENLSHSHSNHAEHDHNH